ncbi:MAG: hypothetical protein ILP08_00235 [Lachnospiraceae bacterium]|nr:hypothetical protein [Lachnospiraceae bacterium]
MDMAVRNIQMNEVRLSDVLEAQIDKDIEQSEKEIATGEYMEAHDAHQLIKRELHRV